MTVCALFYTAGIDSSQMSREVWLVLGMSHRPDGTSRTGVDMSGELETHWETTKLTP